ncbi:hypothetical protein [Bradyrhizobium sp. Arg816]|uniref:hypothetical protein n=1 Tax=Bradyrhizobium sp. Arg816 TaxID=2998491 RepID=UPI00249D9368|nr:hypothetical protein [Bradyrhizobium sp. Arg816]MDI3567599.1 hypothetical protein [Bradyrhizobium sp. Arg816]
MTELWEKVPGLSAAAKAIETVEQKAGQDACGLCRMIALVYSGPGMEADETTSA